MPKINQQLIAKELDLSRATVSRCFTNHPGINPETRAKVFELASRLGYKHMEMRQSRNGHKRGTLHYGVLICSDLEEYNKTDYESPGQPLLEGISEYTQLHKIDVSIEIVPPEANNLDEPPYSDLKGLANRNWNGVLLLYPFPKSVVSGIMQRMPCVSLVEQYGTSPLNCVDVDHYKGIAMVINRLVELGHERIGFFSRSYVPQASWALRRYSAYVEKMTQLGLEISNDSVINVHPKHSVSLEEGFEVAAEQVSKGVTAWVCAADHVAYDLIAELKKRDIRVPRDVSVTGFDGIKQPSRAPTLSTVRIPFREIGFTSAKRLHDMVRKRFSPPQHILLGCELISGKTIGRPLE